jgi:hypothetical protein
MKLDTVTTLLLLLLFAVPGIVFLYAYSRAFDPSERARYIQEQFPVELTLLYLTASAIVHTILLVLLLAVLNLIERRLQVSDVVSRLLHPLLNITTASLDSLTVSVLTMAAYFAASLVLAYLIGRWWRMRHRPRFPIWCNELVELRVISSESGSPVHLKLLLRDGRSLEGEWRSFGLLGKREGGFEIAFEQTQMKRLVWVSSANIAEMDAVARTKSVKFILAEPATTPPRI